MTLRNIWLAGGIILKQPLTNLNYFCPISFVYSKFKIVFGHFAGVITAKFEDACLQRFSRYLLFVWSIVAASMAVAGEQIDKTIDAPEVTSVFVQNVRGEFKVIGWDQAKIQVQGTLDDSAERLVLKAKGKKALIKVEMEGLIHRGRGSNLIVHVPKDIKLRFKGVDTNYHIEKIDGKVDGKTIKGDLNASNLHGKIQLSSVSGTVKVAQSSGVAKIESVSGKVALTGKYEYARVKSMSGPVMVNIDNTDKLKIKSVSGDIAVEGKLRPKADVYLKSVTGNIYYTASGEFNGTCEVASQFGGNIDNQLTTDKPFKEKLQQRKLKFVSGDGSAKLVMNTISGNVTLDR